MFTAIKNSFEFFAGALDPINSKAGLCAGRWNVLSLGQQHRERFVPSQSDRRFPLSTTEKFNTGIGWSGVSWGTCWWTASYLEYGGFHSALSVTHQHTASRPDTTPTPAPSGEVPVVYGPFDGAGGFAAYYPRTGTYARGGVVDGPYDSRAVPTA